MIAGRRRRLARALTAVRIEVSHARDARAHDDATAEAAHTDAAYAELVRLFEAWAR